MSEYDMIFIIYNYLDNFVENVRNHEEILSPQG